MDKHELTKLLNSVADGSLPPEEAALKLKMEPFHEVGDYAKVDLHRGIRQGVPEIIYGAGKTKNQYILNIIPKKNFQTLFHFLVNLKCLIIQSTMIHRNQIKIQTQIFKIWKKQNVIEEEKVK